MTSIYFVGTYPPIMCGIATYTSYLTGKSPADRWGVLSFDLEKYGAPLTETVIPDMDRVWYGISGRNDFCAKEIVDGLDKLGVSDSKSILWFQHETAIWSNEKKFVSMLRTLAIPKIITFHTLHFQSPETTSGLRACEYDLLQNTLPYVDAITVFSRGVYWAVISAFPEHCTKVTVMKHGIHSYPHVSRMSRQAARQKLYDYLMYESDLDSESQKFLLHEKILSDPETVIIGQTGFLCPLKQSESLCVAQQHLQNKLPGRRVVILRIGKTRESTHSQYAAKLRKELPDSNACIINTWLTDNMLATAQKAFDVNFYWPSDCTQSGILAHALGTNAIVAGRQIEGVGETLQESGEIVDSNIKKLASKIKNVIIDDKLRCQIENHVDEYARRYSWKNQVMSHYELADAVTLPEDRTRSIPHPTKMDPLVALTTGSSNSEITASPHKVENLIHELKNTMQPGYRYTQKPDSR